MKLQHNFHLRSLIQFQYYVTYCLWTDQLNTKILLIFILYYNLHQKKKCKKELCKYSLWQTYFFKSPFLPLKDMEFYFYCLFSLLSLLSLLSFIPLILTIHEKGEKRGKILPKFYLFLITVVLKTQVEILKCFLHTEWKNPILKTSE